MAYSDHGLNHLIAAAPGILSRIQETGQSRSLIVVKQVISDRERDRQSKPDNCNVLPPHAGEKNTRNQNRNVSKRRPQVRLLHYQKHWHSNEPGNLQQILPVEVIFL